MKHLLKYLVLCVVLLNSFSCAKKKYPESVIENEPIYYSKFDVNGRPMVFNAGENDFYMYSDVTKDTMNVNEHNSTMRRSNCNGCGPSLKFVIRDYMATVAGSKPSNIDSTIHKGHYEYLKNIQGSIYQAQFTATQNGNGTVDWDFGDGTKMTGSSVSHTFKSFGPHNICASYKTAKGCVSNICNNHFIATNSLNCFVNAVTNFSTQADFSANVTGGKTPYTYSWEFGDGVFSTKSTAQITHFYPYAGSYLARVTVTDADGDKLVTQYNVVTKGDISSCAVNFSRTSLSVVSYLEQTLSKVRVVYTDEQGVSYQSLGPDQPITSDFEILDIKEGELNENGRPTKIVNLRFNCEVYNGTQKLIITNGVSNISVAY